MNPEACTCPLCNQPNLCGVQQGMKRCWCFDEAVPSSLVALLPLAQQGQRCICRTCITSFNANPQAFITTLHKDRR